MPRTPRDPLPKIGEGRESVESDISDEIPQLKDGEESENIENGALQDTPAKAGGAADEDGASVDPQARAAGEHAGGEAEAGEAHPDAGARQGAADTSAENGVSAKGVAEAGGGDAAPGNDVDADARKVQEVPGRVKTLKDYVEGRQTRSPRGVNLEQVKASPKSEELTKIQFARFSFNGVDTTMLDRQIKKVCNGSVEGSDGAQVLDSTDLQSLIDKGVLSDSGGEEDAAGGPGSSSADKKSSDRRKRSSGSGSLSKVSKDKTPALDVLSAECISRVGVGVMGQEYTSVLKSLGKRLDLALREGLDASDCAIGSDIQESQHVAGHRWEAVQRMSAILHEVHDAEVGLSLAEAKQQVSRERELWQEESALLASQHDALLKRAHDELEVAERRVVAGFAEDLLQKLTDTTQNWTDALFERQSALVQRFEGDVLRDEEDIMRHYSSAKALRNMKVSAQVSAAIHKTLGDGSPAPLSAFLQPPHAQFVRSASETLLSESRDGKERGSSPASALARNSVRSAYVQGNGSLPIQFWDETFALSPRTFGRTHQEIEPKTSTNAPPAEYNFIPDTLVTDSGARAAQTLDAANQHRRGFVPANALAALANRQNAGPRNGVLQERGRSTDSPQRFLF